MGCPVSKIVAKGQGSALMRDPLAAAVIFRTLRKAVSVAFTIKIRGGWDDRTMNAVEIARLAESEGVDAMALGLGSAFWRRPAAVLLAAALIALMAGQALARVSVGLREEVTS